MQKDRVTIYELLLIKRNSQNFKVFLAELYLKLKFIFGYIDFIFGIFYEKFLRGNSKKIKKAYF